jgi:hypothetical protein
VSGLRKEIVRKYVSETMTASSYAMLILVIRYNMIQCEDINDLRKEYFFSNTIPGKLEGMKINHEEGGKRVV